MSQEFFDRSPTPVAATASPNVCCFRHPPSRMPSPVYMLRRSRLRRNSSQAASAPSLLRPSERRPGRRPSHLPAFGRSGDASPLSRPGLGGSPTVRAAGRFAVNVVGGGQRRSPSLSPASPTRARRTVRGGRWLPLADGPFCLPTAQACSNARPKRRSSGATRPSSSAVFGAPCSAADRERCPLARTALPIRRRAGRAEHGRRRWPCRPARSSLRPHIRTRLRGRQDRRGRPRAAASARLRTVRRAPRRRSRRKARRSPADRRPARSPRIGPAARTVGKPPRPGRDRGEASPDLPKAGRLRWPSARPALRRAQK